MKTLVDREILYLPSLIITTIVPPLPNNPLYCACADAEQTSLWVVSITIAIASAIFSNCQRTALLIISVVPNFIWVICSISAQTDVEQTSLWGFHQSRHQLSGSLVQLIIAPYLDSHRGCCNIHHIEMVFKKACFINRGLHLEFGFEIETSANETSPFRF